MALTPQLRRHGGATDLCPGPTAAIDEGDKVRAIYDGSGMGKPLGTTNHSGEEGKAGSVSFWGSYFKYGKSCARRCCVRLGAWALALLQAAASLGAAVGRCCCVSLGAWKNTLRATYFTFQALHV